MLIHYHLQVRFKKTYTAVTRAKIQKLLTKFHDTSICLSAIDKQYAKLKAVGLMKMYPQPRQKDNGTWYMLATNRSLTFNGLKYLKRFTGDIVKWLWAWGLKSLGIKKKPRAPKGGRVRFKITPPPRSPGNPFLV